MLSVPKDLLLPAQPFRLFSRALLDWGVIAFICLLASVAPSWLWPVWLLFIAGRLHALGVVLHDAVHMPLRAKTPSLRAIEILAGYPIGSTIEAMRYHHLRHHRDLGLPTDPYLKSWIGKSQLRFWFMSLRYFLLVPLWILRGLYGSLAYYFPRLRNSYARLFLQDRSQKDLTHRREVILCASEDRWQTLFSICIALLAVRFPHALFACYIFPLVLAGYFAGVRLLFEHAQEAALDRSVETTIRTTRNHHLGWTGRLFLAPHNVGYHLVHHLHPQAALENLPKLHCWYQSSGQLSLDALRHPAP